MANDTYDLSRIAYIAMTDRGFIPEFTEEALEELGHIASPALPISPYKDLRELPWVSIDNDDSRDLDQLTYAEKDKIFIAVADVDALVYKGSELDKCAYINTTSVYTPTAIFPMLPEKLSTDLTSLNENQDRTATVTEIKVNDNGEFVSWEVYYAWVRNHDKLTYNGVGEQLEENTATDQLTLQHKHAQKIKEYRLREGSLTFETAKLVPEIKEGEVIGVKASTTNPANELIENFMIASNVAMARTLKAKGLPSLRRVVKVPKRWDKIMSIAAALNYTLPSEPDNKSLQTFLIAQKKASPETFPDLSLSIIKLIGRGEYVAVFPNQPSPGHFDLAVLDYAHTTAPNRRYPDLVSQRILKSFIFNTPLPYSSQELDDIAAHCTQREDDANKVERQLLKSAAALSLSSKIGTVYSAIITGVNDKGTWVRLLSLPIEGMLVRGKGGLDVGDHLQVRLLHVNVLRGFIDFAKA